jgi:hypothetical protein
MRITKILLAQVAGPDSQSRPFESLVTATAPGLPPCNRLFPEIRSASHRTPRLAWSCSLDLRSDRSERQSIVRLLAISRLSQALSTLGEVDNGFHKSDKVRVRAKRRKKSFLSHPTLWVGAVAKSSIHYLHLKSFFFRGICTPLP